MPTRPCGTGTVSRLSRPTNGVGFINSVFAEIGDDIGNYSPQMDEVKSRQFTAILAIVQSHMDEGYLDVAENSLKKLAVLNRKFGNEFNEFVPFIYEKEALCLK